MLRVEGDGGKKAYIGVGFEERGDAYVEIRYISWIDHVADRRDMMSHRFDFNVALQSHAKHLSNPNSSNEPNKPPPPSKDFSLKEGQTFSIKIPGREGRKKSDESSSGLMGLGAGGATSGGIPFLPPPPGKKR